MIELERDLPNEDLVEENIPVEDPIVNLDREIPK